eukprot:scaffold1960_cov242-Pinguiococcus_pyrenoidosus.AAC.6
MRPLEDVRTVWLKRAEEEVDAGLEVEDNQVAQGAREQRGDVRSEIGPEPSSRRAEVEHLGAGGVKKRIEGKDRHARCCSPARRRLAARWRRPARASMCQFPRSRAPAFAVASRTADLRASACASLPWICDPAQSWC